MKPLNYTLVFICLLMANVTFGQNPIKVIREQTPIITCANFEVGENGNLYHAGWYGENATAIFDTPSMNNDHFRRGTALPVGPSYLYNTLYEKNLGQFEGQCLCFDYKVFYDGVGGAIQNINPSIMIFDGPTPQNSTIKAIFVANITVTENDDWVHACAPIQFSNGSTLPSNAYGHWTNVTAAQWDALIVNIGGLAFNIDVGGPNSIDASIGIDNVCIKDCDPFVGNPEPSTNDGAYCCDGENLVKNGNFEAGSVGFMSNYTNSSSLYPGNYDVSNSATVFGANITDHSYCTDPAAYPNNNKYLLVNGKTQQTGSNVIWEQDIFGLIEGETYKFCANFKNIPQCTFDILPEIKLEVMGYGDSGFTTINANPNDACDWINKQFDFMALGNSMTVRIIINETGNGDGNDVAIDDIAVSRLIDPDLNITVQHQGSPQQIKASINTISISDDQLPISDKCEYYWFVSKVNSFPPLSIDFGTFASGNNTGNTEGSSPWNLTTTFLDYNFNPNAMYIVGMYTPACGCYGEGFTYQLTYNNRPISNEMMSEDLKQQIIDYIMNGRPSTEMGSTFHHKTSPNQELRVYPNPSDSNFNISISGNTLKNVKVFSVTGQPVFSQSYSEDKVNDEIDISSFASGIYFIKAQGSDGKQYNAKLVKK